MLILVLVKCILPKTDIPYESVTTEDIPERLAVPQEWLDILNDGEVLVVPAKYRSACYQRFRKAGIKIQSTKVEDKVYFQLA